VVDVPAPLARLGMAANSASTLAFGDEVLLRRRESVLANLCPVTFTLTAWIRPPLSCSAKLGGRFVDAATVADHAPFPFRQRASAASLARFFLCWVSSFDC
jgi:hypothetical protein